jgi:hypothetical protein
MSSIPPDEDYEALLEQAVNELGDDKSTVDKTQMLALIHYYVAKLQVRSARKLERTHWTITPGFIVGVLAMIFAAIAAWPVIRPWFQAVPPDHTAANSQSPLPRSTPVILPAPKTAVH